MKNNKNKQLVLKNTNAKIKTRPYDWAIMLAELGFSARLISHETGIPVPTLYYQFHKEGVRIKDYRDGQSNFAQKLIEVSGECLVDRIDNLLKSTQLLLENK